MKCVPLNNFSAVIFALLVLIGQMPVSAGPQDQEEATAEQPADSTWRQVDATTLSELLVAGDYVPMTRSAAQALLARQTGSQDELNQASLIRKAEYEATVTGEVLSMGTVRLELSEERNSGNVGYRVLGKSNLQRLRLYSDERELPVVALSGSELAVPDDLSADVVHGDWELDGRTEGVSTRFELKLPPSTLTSVKIHAAADLQLASPNAFVVKTQDNESASWLLYPRRNDSVIIDVSNPTVPGETGDEVGVAMTSFVDVTSETIQARWVVNLPQNLAGRQLRFQVTTACQIQDVKLDDGSLLTVRNLSQDENIKYQVTVPPVSTSTTMTIRASLRARVGQQAELPLLMLKEWGESSSGRSGRLGIQQSQLKLQISPLLSVRELKLYGLQERDVSYLNDGGQLIQLEQFEQDASAAIELTRARPLLTEQQLFVVESEASQNVAHAWVRISALTGVATSLQWTLPTTWRATDVREQETDLPLFYEMLDEDQNPETHQLRVHLRSPISARADARLAITLQSTRSSLVSPDTLPGLLGDDHWRDSVLYAVPRSLILDPVRTRRSGFRAVESSDLNTLDWLPADLQVAADAVVLRPTSEEARAEMTTPAQSESFRAVLDYSVNLDAGTLVERNRLRLDADDSLPDSIRVLAPADVSIQVSDESTTQPSPVIEPGDLSGRWRVWNLQLSSAAVVAGRLDCILMAERSTEPQQTAALLVIPQAAQTSGTVQNVSETLMDLVVDTSSGSSSDSDVSSALQLDTSQPVRYPVLSGPAELRLAQQPGDEIHDRLTGHVDSVIQESGDRLVSRNMATLQLYLADTQGRVRFRLWTGSETTGPEEIHVFVDGHACQHQQNSDQIDVLVPQRCDGTVIRVFWKWSAVQHTLQNHSMQVPSFQLVNGVAQQLTQQIWVPSGMVIQSAARPAHETVQTLMSKTGPTVRLTDDSASQPTTDDERAAIRQFDSYRNLILQDQATAYQVVSSSASQSLKVTLLLPASQWILFACGSLLASILSVMLYHMRWWKTLTLATLIVVSLILVETASGELRKLLEGVAWGLIGICVLNLVLLLVRQSLFRRTLLFPLRLFSRTPLPGSGISISLCIACTIWATCATAAAQPPLQPDSQPPQSDQLQILVPAVSEVQTPLVFVPRQLVENQQQQPDVLSLVSVADLQVQIRLEDSQSVVTQVTVQVARPVSLQPSVFPIPIGGSILTECYVNDQKAELQRDTDGNTQVAIPVLTSILPRDIVSSLNSGESSPSTSGPETIGHWSLCTVRYTLRSRARAVGQMLGIDIPLPAAPRTDIQVQSADADLRSATILAATAVEGRRVSASEIEFPEQYNTGNIALRVLTETSAQQASDTPTDVEVICVADTAPRQVKLACTYTVSSSRGLAEELSVGIPDSYRVTAVRNAKNQSVKWSIVNGRLAVRLSEGVSTSARFTVSLQTERRTLSLLNTVALSRLADVSGGICRRMALAVRSSGGFYIQDVTIDGQVLSDVPFSELGADADSLRSDDRLFLVPPVAKAAVIRIAEQSATREARLTQRAVVGDQSVAWSCRCELDVRGRLVFRQNFRIDGDLQVESVTATAGDTNRLESFSYSGGILTVYFREPTRGAIRIVLNGKVPLQTAASAQLPVIEIHDTDILESSLLLSAEPNQRAYIADLAGAVPDTPLDIEETPISATAMRLTVTDELRPLSVRRAVDVRQVADVVAVLSDGVSQGNASVVLLFENPVRQDVRFAVGFPIAAGSEPVLLQNGRKQVGRPVDSGEVFEFRAVSQSSDNVEQNIYTAIMFPVVPVTEDTPTLHALALPIPEGDIIYRDGFVVDYRTPSGSARVTAPLAVEGLQPADGQTVERVKEVLQSSGVGTTNGSSTAVSVSAGIDAMETVLRFRSDREERTYASQTTAAGNLRTVSQTSIQPGPDAVLKAETRIFVVADAPGRSLSLNLPETVLLQSLQIDGSPVPFVTADGVLTMSLPQATCGLVLRWSAPLPEALLLNQAAAVEVPRPVGAVEHHFVTVRSVPGINWQSVSEEAVEGTSRQTALIGSRLIEAGVPTASSELEAAVSFLIKDDLPVQSRRRLFHDLSQRHVVAGKLRRTLQSRDWGACLAVLGLMVSMLWTAGHRGAASEHEAGPAEQPVDSQVAEAVTVLSEPSDVQTPAPETDPPSQTEG
jgi:hypothetical protein